LSFVEEKWKDTMNLKLFLMSRTSFYFIALMPLSACFPSDIDGRAVDGTSLSLLFYSGGNRIDDLIIYEGFRLNSGARVQAECVLIGKDIIGNDECKRYEVYRSSWVIIPEGAIFDRPEMF
jgi:hypothetical protein